jgi:hypothetical protein
LEKRKIKLVHSIVLSRPRKKDLDNVPSDLIRKEIMIVAADGHAKRQESIQSPVCDPATPGLAPTKKNGAPGSTCGVRIPKGWPQVLYFPPLESWSLI